MARQLVFGARPRWLLLKSSLAISCLSKRMLKTSVTLQQVDRPKAGVPYKSYAVDEDVRQTLPTSADVVVIGGGVLGCSTAYHLTKRGVENVILIEKDQLTAGTTWHTAGLVWSLRPSDTEIALLNRSKALMQSLEGETGVHTGWINNGGLFVAQSQVRLNEYKRLHTLGKAFGVESFILDPAETKKLYPLLNVDDLCGSLYSPADGTIDPASYCSSLTRGATKKGAKIVQNCTVTGVQTYIDDFGTNRVKAVETSQGTIQTDVLVNACGVWSRNIGAMAGVTIPLVCMRHAYVVTERIEGIQNMPNMRDHDASVYCKLQGDALSIGGYEPNPVFIDQVAEDFAFSLYELDWDVFSHNIGGAINRIPAVETTGVKSTVCGPESFTADHKPLLGESPEVRGFYLACAFNSGGMMHSIFAEELAKWIINGRPELDMYSYDIRRFSTKYTNDAKWCKEGSHEAYAKSYSIIFPHDETLASRNLRQDALYQVLLDAGCVYQQRQGCERPGWFMDHGQAPTLPYDYYGYYDNKKHPEYTYNEKLLFDYSFDFPEHHDQIGVECSACRSNAAVINMSYFGKYYLIGPDAQAAADWLFTNDMQKQPGSTIYTCMLNRHGGTELDLTVSVVESGSGAPRAPQFEGRGFYLAIGGGAAQHGYSYIMDIIQDHKWRCKLLDHSDDACLISVQGPYSRAILQSLTDTDLSNEAFPFGTNKLVTIANHEARALRISFVGELGWELHIPSTVAVDTYKALMEAGKLVGIRNVGYRAMDSLSLEKGYRMWHADLRSDDSPLESGLGFTCKLHTDTPFLGRQALEQAKSNGLRKRLAFFTLEDHVPLFGDEAIYRDDECVGYLRRGDYAYTLGKPMGCGYVTVPTGENDTSHYMKTGTYSIESMAQLYPASIHLKSPFDPKNERLKGVYQN